MDKSLGGGGRIARCVLRRVLRRDGSNQSISDPKNYLLQDPAGEKRWGFKLADALQRVGASERKIFHGYTFYVTKSVQLEYEVIQRVVDSAGGKVGIVINDKSAFEVVTFGSCLGSPNLSPSRASVCWETEHALDFLPTGQKGMDQSRQEWNEGLYGRVHSQFGSHSGDRLDRQS